MAPHDAVKLLGKQLEAHLDALDRADDPLERAVILKNFAKHCKTWAKTLDKEAAAEEDRAFSKIKNKNPRLLDGAA